MSILDMNFDDVYEPELFDDGQEVELTIKAAKMQQSKSGKNQVLHVTLYSPEEYRISPFTEYLVIPTDADKAEDPAKYNNMKRRLQSFFGCFGLQASGVQPENDFPGATGVVIIGLSEDEQYGKQNRVRKYVVGH